MNKPLLCPCCETEIVVTHSGPYEDLGEHVSNPNGTPSMKQGYQCPNEWCVANNLGAVWINDGGLYMPNVPDQIKWTSAHRIIEKFSVTGLQFALNSWQNYYELGKKAVDDNTRKIHIGRLKIHIIPKTKGSKYPDDQQYMPKLFGWHLEYWKKNDHGYIHVSPDWGMVKFCINQFLRDYRNAIGGNTHSIQKCLNEIECYTSWGHKDDRRYAKITSFILRTVFYAKTAVIRDLATKNNITV